MRDNSTSSNSTAPSSRDFSRASSRVALCSSIVTPAVPLTRWFSCANPLLDAHSLQDVYYDAIALNQLQIDRRSLLKDGGTLTGRKTPHRAE